MKTSLTLAVICCALAGCGEAILRTTPQWDARFGDATRAAFARQVIHPDAGRDARPVNGLDGQAAAAAQKRYQNSFAEPPAPPVFTIGIGSK
ncbi:hypothetical protein [Pseudoduganella lutea]|uniref:Pilus assembly protein n=1 Tax=Pseudoduganella lutea TaxID=321985 RepID=A0A4P6KZ25_9BURK|nr:hypothetical protein [Pseudoduganella lutea]QBE63568.1 hypothetical protein EWM63_11780 [Pseudoduganella lutea]